MKEMCLVITSFLLLACGGNMSDEQRKKLHEGMEDQKIVKLSDAEIVTTSLDQGRIIYAAMESISFDGSKLDSLERHYRVNIQLLKPGTSNALEVENQLIEAYVAGAETGAIHDNIQKLPTTGKGDYDSLIYTRPKVSPLPDGAVKVEGIWNIHLAKKEIIRAAAK
jgi:hypothetical protein